MATSTGTSHTCRCTHTHTHSPPPYPPKPLVLVHLRRHLLLLVLAHVQDEVQALGRLPPRQSTQREHQLRDRPAAQAQPLQAVRGGALVGPAGGTSGG